MRAERGTFEFDGANLSIDGSGILAGEPGTALDYGGASLAGQTRNAGAFVPMPTVVLGGSEDPNAPQLLEVMSQDLGDTSAGFFRNFGYDTLQVGNPNSTANLKLVDNADNAPGTDPEALYVNTLIVPQFATLDLNGLHVYARSTQIDGTVLHGTVSIVPPGGTIPLNTSAPGSIDTTGQVDDWTFYGRASQSVGATLHTGAGGIPAPPAPALNFGQVTLLTSGGQVLATADNSQSGADASLSATVLPADGFYHIHVQAAVGHETSTGSYVLSTYGSPFRDFSLVRPLVLNEQVNGQLDTTLSEDRWDFSALAGQPVQLHLVAASSPDIQFNLSGPGGFIGFTGLTSDSPRVTLPSDGTYTLTARVAGEQAGAYAFVMQTDPIDLTLGTPYHGTLAGDSQSQLFRVQLSTASPLQIRLDDPQFADQNEVYVKLGAPPTRADYDDRFTAVAAADQTVTVPLAASGTWYILTYDAVVPALGGYTLTAVASSILLDGVSPTQLGTTRDDTLTLTGAGFDATATVELLATNGTSYPAHSVDVASPTSLTATFLAGTVPLGVYSVRIARSDGGSSELSNTFTVVQSGEAHLVTHLITPSVVAVHLIPATIEIEYSNTGTDAMPAPLLTLTATQGSNQSAFMTLDPSIVRSGIWNAAVPDGFTNSIQFLASGATPGLLQPGESIQVPVYWAGWLQSQWDPNTPIIFHLSALQADDPTPIDWSALKDSLRPSSIAPDAWNALYPNLVAQLGSTWGQYLTRMDTDASYLASLGENVTDLSRLFSFEILQANGFSPVSTLVTATDMSVPAPGLALSVNRVVSDSIISRNQVGPFGLGWWWSDGWQRTLSVQSDGTVVIADGDGSQRRFQPDSRGGYFDQPGDHATLTKLSTGGYALTDTNGVTTAFRSDGRVDYDQDTNGNRITAGYTNGLLTSLTHSSGQLLQIAYDGGGRIKTITDPATSRTTTYTYDASNEHLMTVTTFDQRTTTYDYDVSGNPATANALLSVTHPEDTHEYFMYDAQGRLSDTYRDGGAEDVTYTYGPAGAVSATDADKAVTNYSFNEMGMIAKLEDPLHHVTHFSYDMGMNLTGETDPAGQSYSYLYDAKGDLIRETDPLGHSVGFGYAGPFNRLTSVTDQNAHTTLYGYDPNGNENSITYADGSIERMTYDAVGDPMTLTNRRGDPINYQYDTSGRVTSETFADGTQMTYHYDGRGNLTSTTDPTGTTTLTYDSIDQLKEIDYPGGLFLKYTYDAAGRRSQMVDQTGFTVNYTYDSVGRLAKLTDGNNALIDQYTYDAAGRLRGEDKGNGTYTTYEYDLAGELMHLVNHGPRPASNQDGPINSRFDYTYDDLGRRATMTTLDGTWTYSYDAVGELTQAVFASNNPTAIPNQDLQYSYDPAGNRTRTIINGVTTAYVSNNLNQYTAIGSETLGYDPDGNLSSMTAGTQTSTYTYNDLNQLVASSTPAGTFTAHYDARGNRVATSFNGQTTRYVVDPTGLGNVVGMYNAGGGLIAHFMYGSGLTSRVDGNGAASYYDFDALGSTADLTGVGGTVLNQYSYRPFGENLLSTESVVNPFQYIGELGVSAEGDGLAFMRNRDYRPEAGTFTSIDPLRNPGEGLYTYVQNNPVQFVDPLGLQGFTPSRYCDSLDPELRAKDPDCAPAPPKPPGGCHCTHVPPPSPPPAPPTPPPGPGPGGPTKPAGSFDPNDKIGPAGYGPQGSIAPGNPLPYRIDFENEATASAPAQRVVITDQLDPNFDRKTFALTGVGFGDTDILIPASSQHYQTMVNVTENGQQIEVDIELGLNPQTGLVTATFQTIDPSTQLPPDVLTGFLPPEDGTGRGKGYFTYVVQPKAGLPTGKAIRNVATVIFDVNAPITTDQVDPHDPTKGTDPAKQDLITIDAGAPNSHVAPLPATETSAVFTVSWSGQDDPGGSGIGSYDVYVSDNGGPFTLWQSATTQTSAAFDGVNGHTYAFYSVAKDNVGHVEATPTASQATTLIHVTVTVGDVSVLVASSDPESPYGQAVTFTAAVHPLTTGLPAPGGTVQFQVDGAPFGAPVNLVGGQAISPSITTLASGSHTITALYANDPNYHANSSSASQTVDKAHLTVTADARSMIYGGAVPALTYTITGFVNGDTAGVLSGAPRLTTTATAASGVGSYAITVAPGSLAAANYDFPTLVAGTLRVTPAPLRIQANDLVRVMGQSDPPLTASYFGFVNGDGPSSLAAPAVLTTPATIDSPAGVYPITVGGATSANYAITFVAGTLTVIAPAPVTMTDVQEVFNKKHRVTQIIVDFSGPVDAGLAESLATYRLTIAGKHRSFTAKNARTVALKSAVYSDITDSVTLVPRKPFRLTKPVQLRVAGGPPTGLADKLGQLIDGNHDGQAGGDAVAVLSKQGVSLAVRRRPETSPSRSVLAVDHLLSAGSREGRLHPLVAPALGEWGSDTAALGSGREDRPAGPSITIVDSAAPRAKGVTGNEHRVTPPARSESTRPQSTRLPAVDPVPRRRVPTRRTSNRFTDPRSDRPAD
jgi:RHS repeat-associated protein